MKIYFAGSIRGGREDKELYMEIIKLLSRYGVVLTEHIGNQDLTASGEDRSSSTYIYERDMQWLNDADVVVAEVTTASLGVGYEVAKAENHKPVLCLYREGGEKRLSAMIQGSPHLTVATYSVLDDLGRIFDTFFEKIKKV